MVALIVFILATLNNIDWHSYFVNMSLICILLINSDLSPPTPSFRKGYVWQVTRRSEKRSDLVMNTFPIYLTTTHVGTKGLSGVPRRSSL